MRKFIVLLMLIASSGAYAAANKWIDSDGHVHYSDQIPPTHARSAQTIGINTPDAPIDTSASSVPATAKPAVDKDPAKDAAAKKAAVEKAAQEAATKAQNQANCAGAKQNLANLKDGMRIATVDPTTGERSYLDDAQRAKSMDEAQQQISKYCQ